MFCNITRTSLNDNQHIEKYLAKLGSGPKLIQTVMVGETRQQDKLCNNWGPLSPSWTVSDKKQT